MVPSATPDIDAVAGAVVMRQLLAGVSVSTAEAYRRDAMAWEVEFAQAERLYAEAVRG